VYNGYVNVLLGNGGGSFAALSTQPLNSSYPSSVALGHFNADTKLDVVTADAWGNTVSVLLSNGDGTLGAPADFFTGYSPRSVAVGDLDGDGKLDVATANSYGLSVLPGNGDGTLGPARSQYLGSNPLSVAAGDINHDGKMDLAATSNLYDGFYAGYANVLLGYGDGTFTPPVTQPLGSGWPVAAAVTDFDGGGFPELVVANADTNDVSVLHNQADWVLPPKISISDATVTEGNAGTVTMTFTVTLSFPNGQPVTVAYATSDGTATAGRDYVATSGTLTFGPNDGPSKTITVQVLGDSRDEYDEGFYLTLSGGPDVNLVDAQAVGTITDDDPPPTLSVNDASVREGDRGTKLLTFTVSLSAVSDKWVWVNYATADGTAKTSGNDYVATSGTVYFAPGQTTATITVVIKGDRQKEGDENFYINLSGAAEAVIADDQGIGTILDDEPPKGKRK
jgi:hypothetical protein